MHNSQDSFTVSSQVLLFLFSFLASNRTVYFTVNMPSCCSSFLHTVSSSVWSFLCFLLQYNIDSAFNFSPYLILVKPFPPLHIMPGNREQSPFRSFLSPLCWVLMLSLSYICCSRAFSGIQCLLRFRCCVLDVLSLPSLCLL